MLATEMPLNRAQATTPLAQTQAETSLGSQNSLKNQVSQQTHFTGDEIQEHLIRPSSALISDQAFDPPSYTIPYQPDLHRAALQKAMEEDLSGVSHLSPITKSVKGVSQFLDAIEILPEWAATRYVILKNHNSNQPVGIISLVGLTKSTKEISRWISPKERGTGLAGNAVAEVLQFANHDNPQLREIRSNPVRSNKASIISIERLGFKHDPHYAATWLAAIEQLVQRAMIRTITGEWADPHVYRFDTNN